MGQINGEKPLLTNMIDYIELEEQTKRTKLKNT